MNFVLNDGPMTQFLKALNAHQACDAGLEFCSRYASPQAAWDAMERAEWMHWWMRRSTAYRATKLRSYDLYVIGASAGYYRKIFPVAPELLPGVIS